MKKILLVLILFSVAAFGQELVLNGGFENGFEYWVEEVNNNQGSYQIARCTTYRPDPGYAVRVHKYMRYFARLKQVVQIPSPDGVLFSAATKLIATKGATSGYYAYAALVLEYQNAAGTALGRTWLMTKVGDYNPQNSPTEHYILTTSDIWQDHTFLLADELANLSGVNPAEVARVAVHLEAYGTGSTG